METLLVNRPVKVLLVLGDVILCSLTGEVDTGSKHMDNFILDVLEGS